jgi:hypothetical protein
VALRAAVARNADRHARDLAPVAEDIRAGGATSLRAIATELNARGMLTRRGGTLARLDRDEPARAAGGGSMRQSRMMSLVEASANVLVCLVIAATAQIVVFLIFGLQASLGQKRPSSADLHRRLDRAHLCRCGGCSRRSEGKLPFLVGCGPPSPGRAAEGRPAPALTPNGPVPAGEPDFSLRWIEVV